MLKVNFISLDVHAFTDGFLKNVTKHICARSAAKPVAAAAVVGIA